MSTHSGIEEATLRQLATEAFSRWITPRDEATGRELVRESDVDQAVRWLVSAERHGLGAFGADLLAREITRLADHPLSRPEPHRTAGAVTAIDAIDLPGQLALAAGVRVLGEGVAVNGIYAVSLAHVGALGVLGLAAREIAEQGYLAVFCANAPAMVAPWGGTVPAVGTNPLAIAAPRAGQPPLVIDYATSPITMAALKRAAIAEAEIPAPGGFTADGEATTEAARVRTIASDSRISSLTALSIELLARAAAGATSSSAGAAAAADAPKSANSGPSGVRTGLLLAFDPKFFGTESFAEDTAALAARWAGAGGHVPARFDASEKFEDVRQDPLEISSATLATLRDFVTSNQASSEN